MTINLLDAHSLEGGTSITGGVWTLSSNTTCSGFSPTLTGDNPLVDFTGLTDGCFATFIYTYDDGTGCPVEEMLQVTIQSQPSQFNYQSYDICQVDGVSSPFTIDGLEILNGSGNPISTIISLYESDASSTEGTFIQDLTTNNTLPFTYVNSTTSITQQYFLLKVTTECGEFTELITVDVSPNIEIGNCDNITDICQGTTSVDISSMLNGSMNTGDIAATIVIGNTPSPITQGGVQIDGTQQDIDSLTSVDVSNLVAGDTITFHYRYDVTSINPLGTLCFADSLPNVCTINIIDLPYTGGDTEVDLVFCTN